MVCSSNDGKGKFFLLSKLGVVFVIFEPKPKDKQDQPSSLKNVDWRFEEIVTWILKNLNGFWRFEVCSQQLYKIKLFMEPTWGFGKGWGRVLTATKSKLKD